MKWILRNIHNVNIDVLFLCFFLLHYNCVVYCKKSNGRQNWQTTYVTESVATDFNAKSYNEIILMQIQCLINLKWNNFSHLKLVLIIASYKVNRLVLILLLLIKWIWSLHQRCILTNEAIFWYVIDLDLLDS